AVAADDAAIVVPRTAPERAALVHAVHRLGHEIVGQVAGIGERPAVTARARITPTHFVATRGAVPVIVVLGGIRIGLVGKRQQFHQVIVIDTPVELAAPEIVVAYGVPGFDGVDVPRPAFTLFVHTEEEQPVLHDCARSPDVGLVERTPIAAPAIAL